MIRNLSIRELEKEYPEAFKALPECYQADDCLDFQVKDDDPDIFMLEIRARPKKDQESILGRWEAEFCNGLRPEWITIRQVGMPTKKRSQ